MNIEIGDKVKYIDVERGTGHNVVKVAKFGVWDGEKVVLNDVQKTIVRNKKWLKIV